MSRMILGFLLLVSPALAEPFGPQDAVAFYSDRAWVHYEIDRFCLSDLSSCLSQPGLESPCGVADDINGDRCYEGIHNFCEAKGHLSGFGVESNDPSRVDITCVSGNAATLELVTFPVLQGLEAGCIDGSSSVACGLAVNEYCRSNTFGGAHELGLGPVERLLPVAGGEPSPFVGAAVVCLDRDVTPTFSAPLASCLADSAGEPVSTACRQEMDAFCQAQGEDLRGGIGFRGRGTEVEFGCVRQQEPWQANAELPESPSLPIDINDRFWKFNKAKPGSNTQNLLSSARSLSFDGRLRAAFRESISAMSFRIQTPEIFTHPLTQVQALHHTQSFETGSTAVALGLDVPEFDPDTGEGNLHGSSGGVWEAKSVAVCDPHYEPPFGASEWEGENRQQSVPSRVSNPFACTATGATQAGPEEALDHDCYDVTIVTIYDPSQSDPNIKDELWGAPVRVVVRNPKGSSQNGDDSTAVRAHVVHVEKRGMPVKASTLDSSYPRSIFEPTITGDGRLLVVNGPTGEIRYSVIPADADACDVARWNVFKPLHAMHTDPDMAEYGVARYPIRNHEGELLGSTSVRGAYPWVDRDGDHIFWMAGASPLYYLDEQGLAQEKFEVVGHPCDQYTGPEEERPDYCDTVVLHPVDMEEVQANTDGGQRLGMSVLGLWTHGKMINPDSRNNGADFGLSANRQYWRNIRLYSDVPEGTLVGGPTVRFSISSAENQFHLHPDLRPDLPRDVVWFMATGMQTDQVAFDDYLDPLALVVSPMSTSIVREGTPQTGFWGRFQDGFVHTGLYRGKGFERSAHLANLATSVSEAVVEAASQPNVDYQDNLQWNIPAYGYLLGGARAEPIAAGGHRGRGLWLDGIDDRVEYLVPEQPQERAQEMEDREWLYTLAIDPRDLSQRRRLLTLPEGSWLDIKSSHELQLAKGFWSRTVSLPAGLGLEEGRWSTLSLLSTGASLYVYLDGYLLESFNASAFRMQPGRITVGSEFKGWIDDFKVIAGIDPTGLGAPERICHHARGTLVGLEPADALWDLAGHYPDTTHAAIRARLGDVHRFDRYVCERPISDPVNAKDLADHGHYLCLGQTRRPASLADPDKCVRDPLLFPEGPLFFDQPRPDSLANNFCLSCHIDSHPSATLRATEALSPRLLPMPLDPRRQPMQGSPKFFGILPKNLFGPGEPVDDIVTPREGVLLDPYTTPGSTP